MRILKSFLIKVSFDIEATCKLFPNFDKSFSESKIECLTVKNSTKDLVKWRFIVKIQSPLIHVAVDHWIVHRVRHCQPISKKVDFLKRFICFLFYQGEY